MYHFSKHVRKIEGRLRRWCGTIPCKMRTYNIYYKDGKLAKRFQAKPKEGAEPNPRSTYNPTIEVIVGLYQEWWGNGQLYMECTYIDGKRDGHYKEWWPNGLVAKEIYYESDVIMSYVARPMLPADRSKSALYDVA